MFPFVGAPTTTSFLEDVRRTLASEALAVQVLSAPLLGSAWPELDRFEGAGYERILVAVFGTELGPGQAAERRLHTVANLYAPTESGPGAACTARLSPWLHRTVRAGPAALLPGITRSRSASTSPLRPDARYFELRLTEFFEVRLLGFSEVCPRLLS
jgi:hypothetical protein